MSNTYLTPEGFELDRPLLLPQARSFDDLFEYVREWDHTTMTPTNGVVARPDLVPMPELVDQVAIGPFLGLRLAGQSSRSLAVRARKVTVDALVQRSELFAAIQEEGQISFELFEHVNRERVLVTAKHQQMIRSRYLAYIDPASIPPIPAR